MGNVVIKVTVSHGQARIAIPKKAAQFLKILDNNGNPSDTKYLLLQYAQSASSRFERSVKLRPTEF